MRAEVAQCDECKKTTKMWNMSRDGKFCRTCFELKHL